ncbi:MAG: hypothetical protein WAU68_16505 [Vitreimonas sp.]
MADKQKKLPFSTTLSGIPDPKPSAGGRLSDLMAGARATSGATSSGKRPKRRRKGQLNDGEWASGYGPAAKKKRDP